MSLRSAAGERVAAKVKDIHEFLVQLGPVRPTHPLPLKAVYHDACHLCHGQQIRQPPRQLLEMIPELQLLPLPESEICCGAAGSYTLTQPEMAQRLGLRRALILATPEQRPAAERVAAQLASRAAGIFAEAAMHTPVSVTEQAVASENLSSLVAAGESEHGR